MLEVGILPFSVWRVKLVVLFDVGVSPVGKSWSVCSLYFSNVLRNPSVPAFTLGGVLPVERTSSDIVDIRDDA